MLLALFSIDTRENRQLGGYCTRTSHRVGGSPRRCPHREKHSETTKNNPVLRFRDTRVVVQYTTHTYVRKGVVLQYIAMKALLTHNNLNNKRSVYHSSLRAHALRATNQFVDWRRGSIQELYF